MSEASIIYIADVYCPWCFGFAPVMKRLTEAHPEFRVRVIGGNLISRPITLEQDLERSPDLVEFWREVEKNTGRSLAGAIRAAENREKMLLYSPGADEILAVLRQYVPNRELEQLFELEDMAYTDGVDLFTESSLGKIADKWNIPLASFERAMNTPQALAETEKNLAEAAKLMGEITSYPSVLLAKDDKVYAVSRGYVHFETVEARFENAMSDLGLPPEESLFCSLEGYCTLGRRK